MQRNKRIKIIIDSFNDLVIILSPRPLKLEFETAIIFVYQLFDDVRLV